MAANIFIAGDVSFDAVIHLERFPEPRQATLFARESYEAAGATSTGKALNLAALGHDVTLAAQLSPDRFGDALRARFERAGVTLHELPDTQTEQHTNLMNADGERISIFAVQRTFDPPVELADFETMVRRADVVILDIINWSRQLIALAKALGKPVWCDLRDYDGVNTYHRNYLEAADYVFLSAEALPDPERFGVDLIARGKKLVVMTRGVEGAVALTAAGERFEVESVTAFSHERYERGRGRVFDGVSTRTRSGAERSALSRAGEPHSGVVRRQPRAGASGAVARASCGTARSAFR